MNNEEEQSATESKELANIFARNILTIEGKR